MQVQTTSAAPITLATLRTSSQPTRKQATTRILQKHPMVSTTLHVRQVRNDSVSKAVSCQGETRIETSSKKRRLRMMDEDSDGVRVKIIPCVKQQFRRRMEATKALNDDFYVPNRAQLMLSFCAEAW